MSFIARLQRAREILEQQGRLSTRALERELEISGDALDEIIEELVDVQQVARREGKVLVWAGPLAVHAPDVTLERKPPPAPRPSDVAEARKVVTIIFADLIGSTSLHERLDAESTRRLMDRYYRALHSAVESHGGTVVKLMGDGVMAAFGVPRVAEDDAIRAVRAGVAMQYAFRELARNEFAAVGDIGLRVGINTGEVVVSAGNTDVVGDPVNVAARLQQEAHDGEVVIGESTRRLVATLVTLAPLGSFALKGRAQMMKAYRVESLDRPVGATTAAFVGRDDELGRITAVYDAAIAAPAARLAVLLGSPGLGKSRMIEEFTRRLGDSAIVLTAQCDAEGGATFAPLAEALRELLAGDDSRSVPLLTKEGLGEVALQPTRPPPGPLLGKEGEEDNLLRTALEAAQPGTGAERERIIDGITALLAGSPASPEETFFVVRRLLAALASVNPVVLVIDDLHWAEPLLLDLVEHLVQWGSGVPLLVLVGARPELRDARSSLATSGGFVSDVVTLSGLDAGAAMRLAANVIGAADLPAAVAARVLATSEGNPFFVAELVRMLVQEGALRQEGDRWITGVGLAELEMPPTIHALLAARIERLRPEDRTVLERAAVVGRHFSRSAVAALLPREVTDLDARLEALRRGELIEPDTGWFLGEPVLRFHHVLIRDAAYRRLLKGTRAELHARVADWIESRAPDSVEHDETLGWHLEHAHQLLGELGPVDAQGRALGERAATHLAAAGRRALARDDLPLAASLLGRALDRLDANDPSRAELALDWCEALLAAGDVGTAAKAIDELGRFIGDNGANQVVAPSPTHLLSVGEGRGEGTSEVGARVLPPSGSLTLPSPALNERAGEASMRLRAWHTCFVGQLTVMTAPQAVHATADAVAAAAAALTALGDAAGEAKAHFVHAQVFRRLGKVGACEAALDRALAAARRAGDRRRANTVLAIAPLAALWGPSPVTRASGRCLDVVRVLRITQGAPAVEAVALSCQAVLEALRGRTDAARRMIAASRKMVEDLGITQRLLEADVFGGLIDLLEGDSAAAERSLRGAYEGLRDLGLGIDAARAAALLARALLAQGRVAEAEALSYESEALAGDDLKAAIAWRGVRAEALARRGEHAAAVGLAMAAVEIAAATDALLDHADARLALAAALRAAGRGRDADAEERRATELWQAKGATLLAERARSDRQRVAPVAIPAAEPITAPPAGRRRVRPNAATAMTARIDAALAARDFAEITANFREDFEEIDHPTGSSYGREAAVVSLERLFRSRDPHFALEPIATLGELLFLARRRSHAGGTSGGRYDVGAYELEVIELIDVDDRGLFRRAEIFAADHLGAAIARLYARYAELLPNGAACIRAAATARSLAVIAGKFDIDGLATAITPDIQVADTRNVGLGAVSGVEPLLRAVRALLDLSEGFDWRMDDVIGLRPDAIVVRHTSFGTDRRSGGAFERSLCELFVFGTDGRIARWERFDLERVDEAVARFDELAVPRPAKLARRVEPNAVTAFWARFDTAFAARDADAVDACFSDSFAETDHTVGASYGRDGALTSIHRLLRSPDPGFRHEALATLGPSLGLVRGLISASGTGGGRFDVGAYEIEEIKVTEVDAKGQLRSAEVFARERLADAVAHLYERYAELLADAPARERAAARAGTLAVVLRQAPQIEAWCATVADAFELVDHRVIGVGSFHGGEAMRDNFRAMFELEQRFAVRVDDVFAACPEGLLFLGGNSGVSRASGGAFERIFLQLWLLGGDGRFERIEYFEAERRTEALARFDELLGSGSQAEPSPLAPFPTREGGSGVLPSVPASGRDRGRGSSTSFANAATSFCDRFVRAWAAGDWDAVTALHSPAHHNDDRRRLMQMRVAAEANLTQLRTLFDVPRSRMAMTPVATRGEHLALSRILYEGDSDGGGGTLAIDYLGIVESDGEGRLVEIVLFDPDDLDAAYAELDARYDVGEGAAHVAHGAFMQAFARAIASRDWDPVVALCSPTFVEYDHRALAVLGTTRGAEAWVQNFRTLTDLTSDTVYRVDHFRSAARGFWSVGTWRGSREGGDYELPINAVLEMDERDRLARADIYDAEQVNEARARFEELGDDGDALALGSSVFSGSDAPGVGAVREPPDQARRVRIAAWGASRSAPTFGREDTEHTLRFANAATRAVDRGTAALAARDWEGFTTLFATGFRHYDRTRMAQLETDGREWLASFRRMVEMTTGPPAQQVLATRDERLALFRVVWRGAEGDIGPSEIDWVLIVEVDGHGDHVAVVAFDPDDLDAGYAELDARWEAGDAALHPHAFAWVREFQRAFAARDWQAVAALHAPDQVAVNHRTVGWGTLRGPGAWVPTVQALVELAPDARFRLDHLRTCERGILWQSAWQGTRDGGPFETPVLVATELDDRGRQIRMDVWDADVFEPARARFAEMTTAPVARPQRFANAATATVEPVIASLIAHDWQSFEQLFAEDFRMSDRRPVVQLELDWEQYVAFIRALADGRTIRADSQLLATRGESLALTRPVFEFADSDVGPSEISFLILTEVDDRGRIIAFVRWDLEDLDAAYAELEARWEAGEAGAHPLASRWIADYRRCFAARDWNAMAAIMAPDLVSQSHRLVSWGTLHGPQGLVSTLQVQMELAPDTQLRGDHLCTCAGGLLMKYAWYGTRDGGAFENVLIAAVELDTLGRARRIDVWEAEQIEQAWARFQKIGAAGEFDSAAASRHRKSPGSQPPVVEGGRPAPDALRIPPNAAARAYDRWYETVKAGNWDAVDALYSASYVFDDRRHMFRETHGREGGVINTRFLFEGGWRPVRTLLATAGERLALQRIVWTTGEAGAASEIEVLELSEVDGEGRFVLVVLFDPGDRAAAEAELEERYVRTQPARLQYLKNRLDAGRDLARIRARLPADFFFHDHRRTGVGCIESADAYVASVKALFELSPDVVIGQPLYFLADEPHATLSIAHSFGTLAEGGAFESVYVMIKVYGPKGFAGTELFELDDVEAAKARFAELRPHSAGLRRTGPDLLRIPPNASTRANDRWWAYAEAQDWDAVRALTAGMVFEDRRRLIRIAGGSELLLADTRHLWDSGWRPTRTLLATAGDRLSLERMLWTLADGGQVSEIEVLKVAEVDAEGRIVAYIIFDADDRRAASTDLLERAARIGADELPASWFEFWRAWNAHDLGRLRALLPADYFFCDHRHTGIGRVEGEAYIASLAALYELSPDVWLEPLYWVTRAAHGGVGVMRWVGTNAEGGEFEAVFAGLSLYRGQRLIGAELFEIADLDAALARFEELRPATRSA